jgi:hypothetical protein
MRTGRVRRRRPRGERRLGHRWTSRRCACPKLQFSRYCRQEHSIEKCKWRNTIGGSGGVKGEHHHGSSYHAAPGQDPVRYWFAGEANVCVTERCGQADVSCAYSVPKVDVDAHGSPVRTLVRKTSWYDAVQVVKAAEGKLAVTIDWEWLEQYRERLLAKQACLKEVHLTHRRGTPAPMRCT